MYWSPLEAAHALPWALLPVSPRSMPGIPGSPPQDKTVGTTITAPAWHRRGDDCFQPLQPTTGGTNDRYNQALGFSLHLYVWGRVSAAVLSHSGKLKLKIWAGGGEREKCIELPSKETCIISRNALCQFQRSYWECSLFSGQHISFAKGTTGVLWGFFYSPAAVSTYVFFDWHACKFNQLKWFMWSKGWGKFTWHSKRTLRQTVVSLM